VQAVPSEVWRWWGEKFILSEVEGSPTRTTLCLRENAIIHKMKGAGEPVRTSFITHIMREIYVQGAQRQMRDILGLTKKQISLIPWRGIYK